MTVSFFNLTEKQTSICNRCPESEHRTGWHFPAFRVHMIGPTLRAWFQEWGQFQQQNLSSAVLHCVWIFSPPWTPGIKNGRMRRWPTFTLEFHYAVVDSCRFWDFRRIACREPSRRNPHDYLLFCPFQFLSRIIHVQRVVCERHISFALARFNSALM